LLAAYQLGEPVEDLAGFFALFSNGVFGGDPGIVRSQIFQDEALRRYDADHDSLSRAELSADPFWKGTPPLVLSDPASGIFRIQGFPGNTTQAWRDYWTQVDGFNPDKDITVPIRISQAGGDTRVRPPKTEKLLEQIRARPGSRGQSSTSSMTQGRWMIPTRRMSSASTSVYWLTARRPSGCWRGPLTRRRITRHERPAAGSPASDGCGNHPHIAAGWL